MEQPQSENKSEETNVSKNTIIHQSKNSHIILLNKDVVAKVVQHKSSNHHENRCILLQKEKQFLLNFSHKNIVTIIKSNNEQSFQFPSIKQIYPESQQKQCSILLERCQQNLYQQVSSNFPKLVQFKKLKTWFYQLASAMDYLHQNQQVVHLDIQLYNCLIDQKENLKLCDFGFSLKIKHCSILQNILTVWASRQRNSFPPEANILADLVEKNDQKNIEHMKTQIDWTKIDVFQFGTTFFNAIFLTHVCNSQKFMLNDSQYKYLVEKKYPQFWKANPQFNAILEQFKMIQGITKQKITDLKFLLQDILSPNPTERPTFQQILQHEFFKN